MTDIEKIDELLASNHGENHDLAFSLMGGLGIITTPLLNLYEYIGNELYHNEVTTTNNSLDRFKRLRNTQGWHAKDIFNYILNIGYINISNKSKLIELVQYLPNLNNLKACMINLEVIPDWIYHSNLLLVDFRDNEISEISFDKLISSNIRYIYLRSNNFPDNCPTSCFEKKIWGYECTIKNRILNIYLN